MPPGPDPAPRRSTPDARHAVGDAPRGPGLGVGAQVGRHPRARARARTAACGCGPATATRSRGRYPELDPLAGALDGHEALLDGEIVTFDDRGRPELRAPAAADARARRPPRSRGSPSRCRSVYVVFDLLWLDGHLTTALPYEDRRRLLARARRRRRRRGGYRRTRSATATTRSRSASSSQLEGVVAKRLDSFYEPGRRSSAWLKVKNQLRQEFVVGGWAAGKGARRDDVRRAAARLLRRRSAAALRGPGRDRVHRGPARRHPRRAGTDRRGTRAVRRPAREPRRGARGPLRGAASSWSRCASPSGPRSGASATPRSSGCAPTRTPSEVVAGDLTEPGQSARRRSGGLGGGGSRSASAPGGRSRAARRSGRPGRVACRARRPRPRARPSRGGPRARRASPSSPAAAIEPTAERRNRSTGRDPSGVAEPSGSPAASASSIDRVGLRPVALVLSSRSAGASSTAPRYARPARLLLVGLARGELLARWRRATRGPRRPSRRARRRPGRCPCAPACGTSGSSCSARCRGTRRRSGRTPARRRARRPGSPQSSRRTTHRAHMYASRSAASSVPSLSSTTIALLPGVVERHRRRRLLLGREHRDGGERVAVLERVVELLQRARIVSLRDFASSANRAS